MAPLNALRSAAGRPWVAVAAVSLVALLVRLPFLTLETGVFPGGDSQEYVNLAVEISDGEFSGMFRTPGYPLFLWFAGLWPGSITSAAAFIQHLIGVGVAGSVTAFGWRFFSPAAGLIAGALAALSPTLVTLEDVVLADYLFGVVMFAGAAALTFALGSSRHQWRLLALTGTLFALAAYMKPIGQALIVAVPVALLASTRDLRRTAVGSVIAIAALVVCLSPWLVRNLVEHDELGMSNQAGVTLFNRAFEVQQLEIPEGHPDSELVRELTAKAEADPALRPSSTVLNELVLMGRPIEEALEIEQDLAIDAILSSPRVYLQKSVSLIRTAILDLDLYPLHPLADQKLADAPGPLRALGTAGLDVGQQLNRLWFVLTAQLLLGLVLVFVGGRAQPAAIALWAVSGTLIIVTVLTHGGLWRYSVQIAPMAWLLGSGGLVFVATAVFGALRRARDPGD